MILEQFPNGECGSQIAVGETSRSGSLLGRQRSFQWARRKEQR